MKMPKLIACSARSTTWVQTINRQSFHVPPAIKDRQLGQLGQLGTTAIVFGTAVAEAVGLNLGLFFCLQLVLMSPKSFLESLVFATAQHSAIRQRGGMVAGILLQLFFVSRLAFSFFMCASSSSCSAHPCRYRQIISKVRLVGWPPV